MTGPQPFEPLAPLRAALVTRARKQAHDAVATATMDGETAIADAQEQLERLLEQARDDGAADAAAALSAIDAAAARAAQRSVLAAQDAVYSELRRRCTTAVRDLFTEAGARDRLAVVLTRQLGGSDGVTVVDTPDGGLSATSPDGHKVDGSVRALVDAALSRMDLEPLWTAE